MRGEPWMNHDERTPEHRRRDQLNSLRLRRSDMLRKLAETTEEIAKLEAQIAELDRLVVTS